MSLAELLREHPSELRADFQQYYGLCVDDMGESDYFGLRGGSGRLSIMHASEIAVLLPPGSRTVSAVDPALSWGVSEYLLARVENHLSTWLWANAKKGDRPPDPPEPLFPQAQASDTDTAGLSVEEFNEELRRLREACNGDRVG